MLSAKTDAPEVDAPVSDADARAGMEAIVASRAFERSDRLRRFLRHVCELTLRGESARINEHLIAIDVFERGEDYSPNDDSVVRRQAHTLRHKLLEYYATEGRDAPIRIELPPGNYVPAFRRHKTPPPRPLPAAIDRRPNPWRLFIRKAALPVVGVLLLIAGWIAGQRTAVSSARANANSRFAPAVSEIWGSWFDDPSGAVICFSNPISAVIRRFEKEVPLEPESHRFRVNPEIDRMLRRSFQLGPAGYLYLAPKVDQGKIGEAIGAVRLTSLLSRAGLPVRTNQSRSLSWENLRSENLILLGHNDANQWIEPLLRQSPLQLDRAADERHRRIRDMEAATSKPVEYRNEAGRDYALISMIRGVDARRNLLLISGLTPYATQMATEFLTNSSSLEDLVKRLRASAPGHAGHWRFQAVLRVELHQKIPFRAVLETVKVL